MQPGSSRWAQWSASCLCATVLASCHAGPKWGPDMPASAVVGDYHRGGGMWGQTLRISQDGTFWFQNHNCRGSSDPKEGPYRIRDGKVFSHRFEGWMGTDSEGFWIVRWGDRTYLVAEESMIDFCNAANLGREPSTSGLFAGGLEYYMRRGDEAKPAHGMPDVPAAWRGYLLARPIRGRVVGAGPKGEVLVDVGERDGLRAGMELIVVRGGFPKQVHLTVAEVRADGATAMYTWENLEAGMRGTAEPGDGVSTRCDTDEPAAGR